MKILEDYEAITPQTVVLARWRGRERLGHVMTRRDGLLLVTLEDRRLSIMGQTIEMPPERYVCSLKPDPAFLQWWTSPLRPGHFYGDASPFGLEAARSPDNTATAAQLALAVLTGHDDALLPLVDKLVGAGRLAAEMSPNGEAIILRKALQGCVDACRAWSAGMDDIFEFIEARKLLGEIDGEDSQ